MKNTPVVYFIILLLFSCSIASAEIREFKDKQGRTIRAEIVSVSESDVSIKTEDGKSFQLKLDVFDEPTQQYIREWKQKNEEAAPPKSTATLDIKKINELFGLPVFSETSLWEEDPKLAAVRLLLPKESKTDFVESYRLYPPSNYQILGAHPFSVVLYGAEGKVTEISMVFANKGDSIVVFGELTNRQTKNATAKLQEFMDKDEASIKERLNQLATPTSSIFGKDKNTREKVFIWSLDDYRIVLSAQDGEYVGLRIIRPEVAEAKGKIAMTSFSKTRAFMKSQVEKLENGDVLIKNIPMVDQGPKGYCAPAVFERCFRYIGVPADMYVLAMAGKTMLGGGTYIDDLVDGIERWAKSQGRKINRKKTGITMSVVKSYIDDGQPIAWILSSSPNFNTIANKRTAMRKETLDMKVWAKTIAGEDTLKYLAPVGYGHVCLIIGYNAGTKEVAISDSWGKGFELRWVRVDEADAVSRGEIVLLEP